MRNSIILTLLACLPLAAMPAAAQEEIKPVGNKRIVGGEKTDIRNHPWQVAFDIRIDGKSYLCGGSIIADRWVLTAAHCFKPSTKPGEIRAKAGATNYVGAGRWVEAERVVLHEAYNPRTFENDLALVRLKATPAGQSIPLAKAMLQIPPQTPLEVTGWGATAEDGNTSPHLLKATIPSADQVMCNAANAYAGKIKSGMMCAGFRDGGTDSCQGDSGGPLVWKTSDGPVLVGVVSWGEGCARKLKYGVYSSVSFFRSWIEGKLLSSR